MNVTKRDEAKTLDKRETNKDIHSRICSPCQLYFRDVIMNWASRILCWLFFRILIKRIPKSSVSIPKQFLLVFFIIVLPDSSLIVAYQNRMSGFPHSFLTRTFTHHHLAIGDLNRIKNFSMNQIDHMIRS